MARLLICVALLFITACVLAVYTSDLPSPFLKAVNLKSKISHLHDRIIQLRDHGNELTSRRLRKQQSSSAECRKAYQKAWGPFVQQCLPFLAIKGGRINNSQVSRFCILGCDGILNQLLKDLLACGPDSAEARAGVRAAVRSTITIIS